MQFPYEITNKSFLLSKPIDRGYEVWYWKLNPINTHWSFWFRFTLLKSPIKSVGEVWGIFTERDVSEDNRITKVALKNSYPIDEVQYNDMKGPTLSIAQNTAILNSSSKAEIQSEKGKLGWELNFTPCVDNFSFNFIPSLLWKAGVRKNYAVTVFEKLKFDGTITVNERQYIVDNAWGMQGHLAGRQQGHSWAWAHSCIFYNKDSGELTPIVLDVLTARAKLGKRLYAPPLTSLTVRYGDNVYLCNTIQNLSNVRSTYQPQQWDIFAKVKGISIIIQIKAELDEIAGVRYEDTDGSELFCYNTKMADIELRIVDELTRKEKHFVCPGFGAFEWVQRKLWDQVPLSIE